MRISEVVIDPDVLLTLSPEELGGLILTFIKSFEGQQADYFLNEHNFSIDPRVVEGYPDERKPEIIRVLMEGWAWLVKENMIVPRPNSYGEGWMMLSRNGQNYSSNHDVYRFTNILPVTLLHPSIKDKVWSLYIQGQYSPAVFEAFKQVEIAVRSKGQFRPEDLGDALMRKAFDDESGPLTNMSLPPAERKALSHLFAGAIGWIKNPKSHRDVLLNDPVKAAQMLVFASYLLSIVDERSSNNTSE